MRTTLNFPYLTSLENVLLPLGITKIPSKQKNEKGMLALMVTHNPEHPGWFAG